MLLSAGSQAPFRIALVLFACVLGGFALWQLAAELARSDIRRLPVNSESAAAAATARARAQRAAEFGAIRGDLWAEAAFTYAAQLWPGAERAANSSTAGDDGRGVVERALAYAPHASGVWLMAAGLASRLGWPRSDALSALKMSYFTGPNEIHLIPLRLFTATHSNALTDDDVQRLVQREVRMILTRWPELKPALPAAYDNADLEAKRFLERAVADADPAFLRTLRASAARSGNDR
jgi:hypothetical protein